MSAPSPDSMIRRMRGDASAPARHPAVGVGAWAGVAYVAAWVIGLLLAPSAPNPFASAARVNQYFVAHNSAALAQAVFVHAIAGVALLVFVFSLIRYLADTGATGGLDRVVLGAGVGAAVVSFVQVALAVAPFAHVDGNGGAGTTARALSAWILWTGAITALLLMLGGLAFLVDSDALNVFLVASLPLLLLWSLATSITMLRRREPRPMTAAPGHRGNPMKESVAGRVKRQVV